jgi:hypothetical protein
MNIHAQTFIFIFFLFVVLQQQLVPHISLLVDKK